MSEMTSRKPLRVAIGIVVRDGRILISRRRAGTAFADYWEFPGGKCEPSESPVDCVIRELLEELDIRVTPARALPAIEYTYPGALVTLYPFVCRLDAGDPRAISAAEFRWVMPDALGDFRFSEANDGLLKKLAAVGGIDLPAAGA
jgi:8-oxo-dGTP diphosphatase